MSNDEDLTMPGVLQYQSDTVEESAVRSYLLQQLNDIEQDSSLRPLERARKARRITRVLNDPHAVASLAVEVFKDAPETIREGGSFLDFLKYIFDNPEKLAKWIELFLSIILKV